MIIRIKSEMGWVIGPSRIDGLRCRTVTNLAVIATSQILTTWASWEIIFLLFFLLVTEFTVHRMFFGFNQTGRYSWPVPHESKGLTCPTHDSLFWFTQDGSRSLTCLLESTGLTHDPLTSAPLSCEILIKQYMKYGYFIHSLVHKLQRVSHLIVDDVVKQYSW